MLPMQPLPGMGPMNPGYAPAANGQNPNQNPSMAGQRPNQNPSMAGQNPNQQGPNPNGPGGADKKGTWGPGEVSNHELFVLEVTSKRTSF